MSRICEFTGKRPNYGNTVSHANNKNRTRWELNLKQKAYEVPELGLGRTVRLNLSTRAIRTIDKYGNFTLALMKAKHPEKFSTRLQQLRRQIHKRRVDSAKPKGSV